MDFSLKLIITLLISFLIVEWSHGQHEFSDSSATVISDLKRIANESSFRLDEFTAVYQFIEQGEYNKAITQVAIIAAESETARDTLNLIEAYRLLTRAHHYSENFEKRDHFRKRIQAIAPVFGFRVELGSAYLKNRNAFYEEPIHIYDELLLLEDPEGSYTFEEVSSAAFRDRFVENYTLGNIEETFIARENYRSINASEVLFNQDAVHWMKLKLVGSSTEAGSYFFGVHDYFAASWDYIEIFELAANQPVQKYQLGLALPYKEKDFKYNHNIFEIQLDTNEVKTLYFRLEGSRKKNSPGYKPTYMTASMMDMKMWHEFDGYYYVPDSITHTHDFSQPRRLNHIFHSITFVEDVLNVYSLDYVAENWEKLSPDFPFKLMSSDTAAFYWARVNLIGADETGGHHSFMISELWDDIEVYVPDGTGSYRTFYAGSNLAFADKTVPGLYNVFRVHVKPRDTLSVYAKLKSNRLFPFSNTSLNKFEFAHIDEYQLWQDHSRLNLFAYVSLGALLILLLYYSVLFIINREQTYLFLVIMFTGMFLAILNDSNLISSFPSNRLVVYLGTSIAVVGLFRFAEVILNIKGLSKGLHRFNRILFYLLIVLVLIVIGRMCTHYLIDTIKGIQQVPWFILAFPFYLLFLGLILFAEAIYAYLKKVRYAMFFLIFNGLLISAFLLVLALNVFFPDTVEPDQGNAITAILIATSSLGLMLITAYRLKHLRADQLAKEAAEASERAKHQFLANMSHEIRTPMNAIKGMTDILIRREPKKEQKEYLDGIKQSSDSLLVIINDILDLSKIEAGKIELEKEPFSINELVNNVHLMMQFKAEEKGLELNKNLPDQNLQVIGDATRLRQILVNLIGNAIKFTEKGVVTTHVKLQENEVHFTVSDTGVGIGADRLDKIFESFEQAYSDTTRKFGGTGLGLSISKKLVELQGGRIWVESEKGKGSQFHFTIPGEVAEKQKSLSQPVVVESTPNTLLKGIRILLVEDNTFNAIVAEEELEDAIEGVVVDVAENGAIAVEKVRSGAYDLILMDVQMPVMNGYEATEKIRAMTNGKSGIPIIAMTANVMREEVELCYQAGMNDFIGKPFETNTLIKKMNELIQKK
jgi:signal transduction histidine kinase/ActR/RegA family two-component response regulator